MKKFTIAGFTNYFTGLAPVLPVEVLEFDNNKYAKVRLPDGSEDSVKAGYLFANKECSRRFPDIVWFQLGGGARHEYHARKRKTEYLVYADCLPGPLFLGTKAKAVSLAVRLAQKIGAQTEVIKRYRDMKRSRHGVEVIICTEDNLAFETASGTPKYMRGHGKAFPSRDSLRR